MYNWKDTRNYRRFRDENGNVIANIIYVDGEEVAVSDEVYEAYGSSAASRFCSASRVHASNSALVISFRIVRA